MSEKTMSMNEKLLSAEDLIAQLQSKWEPMASQMEALNNKINGFADELRKSAEEAKTLQTEFLDVSQKIALLHSILHEAQAESRELATAHDELLAKHGEDKHLRDSLTTMFGEAFQVVSRFMETAQRIGIVDKGKVDSFIKAKEQGLDHAVAVAQADSEILPSKRVVDSADAAPEESVDATEPADETDADLPAPLDLPSDLSADLPELAEERPAVPEPVAASPQVDATPEEPAGAIEPADETDADLPAPLDLPSDISADLPELSEERPAVPEPVDAAPEESVDATEPADETDADLPSPLDLPSDISADLPEIGEVPPELPDVTTTTESLPPVDDIDMETETKSASEIASQLDLSPLVLETPPLSEPQPSGQPDSDELDDQTSDAIEAMLKDMSKPIST